MDAITLSCPPTAPDTPESESTGWSLIHSRNIYSERQVQLQRQRGAVSENVVSETMWFKFWLSSCETLDKWLFKDRRETISFYLGSTNSCASPRFLNLIP